MESVMSRTSKVMVDSGKGGNQVLYLPLDQLLRQAPPSGSETPETALPPSREVAPAQDRYRSRERLP
jgi:membrane protease subunit HflK